MLRAARIGACGAVLLILLTLTPAQADPEKYYVAPSQFNGAVQVMQQGFANIFGLFTAGTGSFQFDAAAKTISRFRLAIDAASLTSSNSANADALTRMFGASAYPEISFVASDPATFTDNKAEIKGKLTIHGVSKDATFAATLNHVGNSPEGGGMWSSEGPAVGLSLRGAFKRADFGMADDDAKSDSDSQFGDSVSLMLELQAIKQ